MKVHWVGVVAVILASGCTLFPEPESQDTTRLQLTGSTATIEQVAPSGLTILVVQPRALQPYATPRFAYLLEDRELRYYARHEWIADPARMLHPAVIRAVEASGGFAAVIAPPTPANADIRLDLEILEMHQDFRSGDGSELVLRVRSQVVMLSSRRVVGTRVFEVREPAARNPIAGAAAADRAFARLLEELTAFTAELAFD
jgi:cholesterol transport system auxiliary component